MNASIAGSLDIPNMSISTTAKDAVISPCRMLAFGKLGLREEVQKGIKEQFASLFVFKRMGKSNEVSKRVRFLLSEGSSFMTGNKVTIDGGVRLT